MNSVNIQLLRVVKVKVLKDKKRNKHQWILMKMKFSQCLELKEFSQFPTNLYSKKEIFQVKNLLTGLILTENGSSGTKSMLNRERWKKKLTKIWLITQLLHWGLSFLSSSNTILPIQEKWDLFSQFTLTVPFLEFSALTCSKIFWKKQDLHLLLDILFLNFPTYFRVIFSTYQKVVVTCLLEIYVDLQQILFEHSCVSL